MSETAEVIKAISDALFRFVKPLGVAFAFFRIRYFRKSVQLRIGRPQLSGTCYQVNIDPEKPGWSEYWCKNCMDDWGLVGVLESQIGENKTHRKCQRCDRQVLFDLPEIELRGL